MNGTAPGDEYNLTPNETTVNHQYPSISGNWVGWEQSNLTPGYSGSNDIFVNDTNINQTIPIALSCPGVVGGPSISFSPVSSLYRIAWEELDTGTYNVYLYTNTSNGVCPVANFSNNFAGGSAPITVQFADTSNSSSSNPITNWFWDFGDGSNSTQHNPAHPYNANGAYDVSLTVSNSLCRNTTTIANSVVVGQPIANFTTFPTTSIVPATIAFTDTSLGYPNQWNWSWGDGNWTNGTTSVLQNPVHTYYSPGTYTVSLTATNTTYGSDTLTRANYITVLPGANVLANTTINGIAIQYHGSQQYLVFNYATLPEWTFYPNSSVLNFEPPSDCGFQNISIYTTQPGGFLVFPGNTTIAGTISSVQLQTEDITPIGFSASTGGPFCSVNYSVDLPTYPVNALLNTQIWEGATASDATDFNYIAEGSHYSGSNGTAYTTKIIKTNFPAVGTAKLYMSVNASLVASKPFGANEVLVERIDDSGTYGQVLGTHFLYYDSTNNLDYFEVDSPNGLSTFGLSFLEGAGNLFQLITLAVSSQVQNQAQVHYAGSGSWGQWGNAPDTYSPTAVQTQVVPQATQPPSQTVAVPPGVGISPPAPTAVSTDVGIMGWLAETVGGHIYLVAAVVIVVVSLIYIRQRRRRFDPLG
jgi:PKD repeat protein